MSALRSALLDVLRGLDDAELARIVRAAPDDVLRPLVQIGLNLEADDQEEAEEAAPPRRAPRKPKAPKEAAPGPRPTRPSGLKDETVERILAVLKKLGPSSGKAIVDKLGCGVATVSTALSQLEADGRVRRVKQGRITLNEAT